MLRDKIKFKPFSLVKLILTFAITCFALLIYVYKHYQIHPNAIQNVSFKSSVSNLELVVYSKNEFESEINFNRPHYPLNKNGRQLIEFNGNVRQFRIYFGLTKQISFINEIQLKHSDHQTLININELRKNSIHNQFEFNQLLVFEPLEDGYLELNKEWITQQEFIRLVLFVLLISIPLAYLLLLFLTNLVTIISALPMKEAGVHVFLCSLFLPHPIYNYMFVFSFLLVLKDLDFKRVFYNRISLLMLIYFLVILLRMLYSYKDTNLHMIETYLPILFLPFYVSCIKKELHLNVLPYITNVVGLYLLGTSLVNVFLYHNLFYLSFDSFSKHLHPVYFSYLLCFSLIVLEFADYDEKQKPLKRILLFIFLVLCGSKMLLIFTFLIYLYYILKQKRLVFLWILGAMLVFLFTFQPTKQRFVSVLKPTFEKSTTELNGLSIRFILWEESLLSLNNWKKMAFGLGFDEAANRNLENRLKNKGLEKGPSKYDAHNQYISTLYKMGILGLSSLLLILFWAFKLAYHQKNQAYFLFLCLFLIAMSTESLLQRALGVYFFVAMVLFYSLNLADNKVKTA